MYMFMYQFKKMLSLVFGWQQLLSLSLTLQNLVTGTLQTLTTRASTPTEIWVIHLLSQRQQKVFPLPLSPLFYLSHLVVTTPCGRRTADTYWNPCFCPQLAMGFWGKLLFTPHCISRSPAEHSYYPARYCWSSKTRAVVILAKFQPGFERSSMAHLSLPMNLYMAKSVSPEPWVFWGEGWHLFHLSVPSSWPNTSDTSK